MSEIKIGRIVLGICATNCYFIYKENASEIIVIDPADRGDYIYGKLTEQGFIVKGILLTHGHFDHILGSNELRELTKAPIYAYEAEKELCEDVRKNISASMGKPYTVTPDYYVKDNEEITIAGMTCKVLATPGHTIGSCCYYFEQDGILISGDTLFQESVGRTDFPTGSGGTLNRSIKERLFPLPDDTKVFSGHGEQTTIGYEKKYNPFCR